MANYREIISKAVISKGKKVFHESDEIAVNNSPSTILGCWVINHKYNGVKQNNQIVINGSFDVNIWYSYDNDTKTDVVKEMHSYTETVNMRDIDTDCDNVSIIIRSLVDPKCIDVKIDNDIINYHVDLELGIELVGDLKVKVEVNDSLDEYDLISEEKDELEDIDEKIDKEIKEDYL